MKNTIPVVDLLCWSNAYPRRMNFPGTWRIAYAIRYSALKRLLHISNDRIIHCVKRIATRARYSLLEAVLNLLS